MKTLHALLSELDQLGVKLWAEGEQLRVRAPNGAMNKALVAELQQRKTEILSLLRGSVALQTAQRDEHTVASSQNPNRTYPLSFAQHRFWFLDQLGSGSTYNLPGGLVLSGSLVRAALHRALQEILDRHHILRTTYQSHQGEVKQSVRFGVLLPLPVIDLCGLDQESQAKEVEQLLQREAHTPFDLSRDLMLRTTLIRRSEELHELLFTMHHIASDAWSLSIFTEELMLLYNTFCNGNASPLPPLPIQYGDYSTWQRTRDLRSDLEYFQRKLASPPPLLELPLDAHPPLTQDYRGGRVKATLSPRVLTALRSLSRSEQATPFVVLLATFNLLLHRYTGQEDIIVGSPSIGRSQKETERLIGLFLNLLALRTSLAVSPSFRELLQRTREVVLDAYTHQEAPFEKLVEILAPDRRPGRDPLFEVMLNYVKMPPSTPILSNLQFSMKETTEPDALRALTLYVYEHASDVALELVYQRALFGVERMSCFLEQFVELLEQVVLDPDRKLSDYSLVTESFRPKLPDLRSVLERPVHAPITEQLRKWAKQTPAAIAIESESGSYSYAQLLQSAKRIATALLHQGLCKGDVVGVYGARSFGTVAALFGALLAGGVMLPLELDLPPLRQRRMLEIGKARFVLLIRNDVEDQADGAHLAAEDRKLLAVDAKTADIAAPSPATELPTLDGGDPAYIMFTSGTTGEPKGILGVHRGPAHFLSWQRERFGVGPGVRCAQCAGLSFELMLRDVFLAPTSGATLCLPPPKLQLDGGAFLEWLAESRITLLHPVPSLSQAWLQHASEGYRCETLRHSLFLGEPLSDTLVQRWRRHFPNSEVYNFYGPSETTMAKCCYHVPDQPPPGIQPVGFPLPNTQALVLNAEGALCGVGEPGQIVLRTPFRTLGYVNPTQNEKKFVPNPQRNDPDDLIYYSGDRGRYRPDGSIDIMGRVDHEIKIRGVRIQPGEISAVLEQHPAVAACTIVIRTDGGEKQIIAYVVPREGQIIHTKELRHYLAQRLPSALVPGGFMFLSAIPVTSNGKVDRDALPLPVVVASSRFAVPRSELERKMAELWQQLLGVHSVGIQDNFFELGGHSLVAVHLMARIQQQFGQRLPLSVLFACPTVETLVSHLSQYRENASWPTVVPIQSRGKRTPLFCAPGAGGNVLYLYQLARQLGPEQPFYALQARGLDGITEPHLSVEAMAADYLAAIKTVQPVGPYRLAGHSFGGQVVFELAQQLLRSGEKVSFVALLDPSPPAAAREDLPIGTDESEMLEEMAAILGFMAGQKLSLSLSDLRELSPEERLSRFQAEMESAGLLPVNTDRQQVKGWLSVFKANYQIHYTPCNLRPARVIYFCATDQSPEEKERRLRGWKTFTDLELHDLEGTHSSIMVSEPHVEKLARELTQLIDECGT